MSVLDRLIDEACRCKECGKVPQDCECQMPKEKIRELAKAVSDDLYFYLRNYYPYIMKINGGFQASLRNHLTANVEQLLKAIWKDGF